MSTEPNLHWTSEADLLESYVLNRLEVGERERLEAHLRVCERCQEAVKLEQQLVAGVRRSGREALKARIAERVRPQPRRAVGWYHVVGVAATVVLLITVGIHYQWFFRSESKQQTVTEQTMEVDATPEGEPMLIERDQATRVEKKEEEHRAAPESVSEKGAIVPLSKEKGSRDALSQLPREPAPIQIEEGREAAAERAQPAVSVEAKNEQRRVDRFTFAKEAVWLEGMLLPSVATGGQKGLHLSSPQTSRQTEQLRVQKLDSRLSKTDLERVVEEAEAQDAIVVEQRPVSALSPSQRAKQQLNTVPAELRRIDGALFLTIFLDSPVRQQAAQDVSIEQVREDSILVMLGTQRIAYKLPPEWEGQLPRQVKAKE